MNLKMNMKKWMAVGLLGACVCVTTAGASVVTNKNYEWKETIASTSLENTVDDDTTESSVEETSEDEAIMYSTYLEYGEGSVFVTVNKDSNESEEETGNEIEDIDNLEEVQDTTEEPEAEESTEPEEEVTESAMLNTGILSSQNLIDACFTGEEKTQIMAGEHFELRVTFHNASEKEMKKTDISLMNQALTECEESVGDLSFGNYVQIIVEKRTDEASTWETLTSFNEAVKVQIDIKNDYQVAGATYYLVELMDDSYEMHEDEDLYMETLTCEISGSHAFGLCCKEQEEAVVTPEPTEQPSFIEQIFTGDLCLWHMFMCGTFVIGFTWILAINSTKKRTIFLVTTAVLLIVMGILGSCSYDWPFAIVFLVILALLHLLRLLKNKK